MREVELRTRLMELPLLSNLCNIPPDRVAEACKKGYLKAVRGGKEHTSPGRWRATEEDLWEWIASLNPGEPAYKRAVRIGKIGKCLICHESRAIANPGKPVCMDCFGKDVEEVGNNAPVEVADVEAMLYDELARRNGQGMSRTEMNYFLGSTARLKHLGEALENLRRKGDIENIPKHGTGSWANRTMDNWHIKGSAEVGSEVLFEPLAPELEPTNAEPTAVSVPVPAAQYTNGGPVQLQFHRGKPKDFAELWEDMGHALAGMLPKADTSRLEEAIAGFEARLKVIESAPKEKSLNRSVVDELEERVASLQAQLEVMMAREQERQLALLKDPPLTQASIKGLRDRMGAMEKFRAEFGS